MNMTVVLAEDDPDIQLVARLALKRAGFIVTVGGNGQEALAAIRRQPPDVVLLDWMMPELDGPETCRQLKADPATAGIPADHPDRGIRLDRGIRVSHPPHPANNRGRPPHYPRQ